LPNREEIEMLQQSPVAVPVADDAAELRAATIAGLSARPRTLPCRFFYDALGSHLFERICELPEYYPTRTEDAILASRAGAIAAALPHGGELEVIELGCGNAQKTRRLLDALTVARPGGVRYVPVDISASMLAATAATLHAEYPGMRIQPIAAEYEEALALLGRSRRSPRLFVFLGSNLGNFDPDDARRFLGRVVSILDPRGAALFGLDMKKDPRLLEAAYDDAAGVTAAFNLNLLRRIQRELGAELDLDGFAHRAVWNPTAGRMEMHLVSRRRQRIVIDGCSYAFAEGEGIHTESSYKYDLPGIDRLFGSAGLTRHESFLDDAGWFGVHLFRRS
jgi:L-histidine Nalpha-methyltransferase